MNRELDLALRELNRRAVAAQIADPQLALGLELDPGVVVEVEHARLRARDDRSIAGDRLGAVEHERERMRRIELLRDRLVRGGQIQDHRGRAGGRDHAAEQPAPRIVRAGLDGARSAGPRERALDRLKQASASAGAFVTVAEPKLVVLDLSDRGEEP